MAAADEVLDDRGDDVRDTVRQLSAALQTVSDGRDDLFATVRNPEAFTAAAAAAARRGHPRGGHRHRDRGPCRRGLRRWPPCRSGVPRPRPAGTGGFGGSLTESLRYLATFPFPLDTYRNAVRGDYANGTVILDLRLPVLDTALLIGTPFEGSLALLDTILGVPAPPR